MINAQSSTPAPVTAGVPQGTVTTHLWFLLYIADLLRNASCKTRLFADDYILYNRWLLTNKLVLFKMTSDCWKIESPYVLFQELSSVEAHLYVSLQIPTPFTGICILRKCAIEHRGSRMSPEQTSVAAGKGSRVLPIILWLGQFLNNYASSAWVPSKIRSLERIQCKAARLREQGSVSKPLVDLGWDSIEKARGKDRSCV